MVAPKVSVIVCFHNEEKHLPTCLVALKGQTYPNFEVIVVDDGSIDKTAQIAQGYDVKVILIKHSGLPTARNVGVENASGDIIAFTDADCAVEPHWLEKLIQELELENCDGVVGGTVKVLNSQSFIARCITATWRNPIRCTMSGYNMAYKKEVIMRLGGFDPHFIRGGDYEFNLRALQNGCKVGWAKDATVFFSHPDTVGKLIRQRLADGFWLRKILKKHPWHVRQRIKDVLFGFIALFPFFRIRPLFIVYKNTKDLKLTLGHFLYSYTASLAFCLGFLSPLRLKYTKMWQSPLKPKFKDIPWDATYKNFRPTALSLDVVEKHMNLIIEWGKPKNCDFVLDVGCGKGYLPHQLAMYTKAVVGLDVNSNYVKYAKQNHACPNVAYIVGDAIHLPLKDKSFDIVICREVIEHVEDPAVVLQEIRRVMREKAIISTPNLLHFERIMLWKFRRKNILIPPGHLREYTYDSFSGLLEKSGFMVRKMRGTYFSFPLALGLNLLVKCECFRWAYISLGFIMARIFPKISNYLTACVTKEECASL